MITFCTAAVVRFTTAVGVVAAVVVVVVVAAVVDFFGVISLDGDDRCVCSFCPTGSLK